MPPYRSSVFGVTHPLHLVDFFNYYEELSHQIAAINELERRIKALDPGLLESNAEWFDIWKADGKMHGKRLRRHGELDSL